MRYRFRVSKLDVSARATKISGHDDLKQTTLTRDDVAKRLGVSISTVRRFEGTRLHPVIDAKSVRRFKASDVERLAKELNAEQRSPRDAQQAVVRAAEMPKGELAALVFERLEQRHSLSEIVIALRVPPEDVRELYHTWLVGLSCSARSLRCLRGTPIRTRSGTSHPCSWRNCSRRCRRSSRRG